ncbi:HD domain-containing protein [Allorhodopirellula heiligendammensis]|uniref:HD/PDEase domain-containing protein n=1 Tax=Allorhodopirellula heiligendammensis TaxID=2714739 RepID=A0A5C6BDP2_9BACT|nr:HD domain-containing protein [Allorhodopirellula heiligendammensis]TWU10243.1 hypothetical protein Poly21_52140 [Allorhodopirellula heiligendammensis]
MTTIPEIAALRRGASRLRIPPSIDVPMTERVRRLVDAPPMRRLASISQLGLVSLVYPGATHSRLEHSLGVYANSLRLLDQFSSLDAPFAASAQEAFVVAALVHDAGHWPFCHPIEDMGDSLRRRSGQGRQGILKHEDRVAAILCHSEIADCLQRDWSCNADDVMSILRPQTHAKRPHCQLSGSDVAFLASCLSGPIDIDKLDYLQRDSLHSGVPYGRNFDPDRIISALCIHPNQPRLAISEKGRTAAEMMVFGRYVMFSEVYWHHTVRAATAMLQRALFAFQNETTASRTQLDFDLASWCDLSDADWIASLRSAAAHGSDTPVQKLVDGLFGASRVLLKRAAEFNVESGGRVHATLARRPYWWLVECSRALARILSFEVGTDIDPTLVLIDAPPVKLEVDINIDVITRTGDVMPLGDVSPVASVLANRQFDNHVKRVRVFVPADVREALLHSHSNLNRKMQEWLVQAAEQTQDTVV